MTASDSPGIFLEHQNPRKKLLLVTNVGSSEVRGVLFLFSKGTKPRLHISLFIACSGRMLFSKVQNPNNKNFDLM